MQVSLADSKANTFYVNENLAHWLTFKIHSKNQEHMSGKSWDSIRLELLSKNTEGQEVVRKIPDNRLQKRKQAKKCSIWP